MLSGGMEQYKETLWYCPTKVMGTDQNCDYSIQSGCESILKVLKRKLLQKSLQNVLQTFGPF